jgi:D-glycero-alpha-D-manno-heptose-7-phosphate kinase
MILSRTPLRICIAGGGTDLPSFYEKHSGLVLSMAIDKHIYISYKPDDFENLLKLRYSQLEVVDDVFKLKNHRARAVLVKHGILTGCEINSGADIPSNTGLGSSGSFLVGLINCVRAMKGLTHTPDVLGEEACKIEIEELKEPVGKQDQYIASYGGLRHFDIDVTGNVNVKNITLGTPEYLFTQNLCVYYLNIKRDASDILQEQQKLQGNTADLLGIIKEQAISTLSFLKRGEYDAYGKQLDDYWTIKKQLSSKISLPIVDQLYDHVKKEYGVLGGKVIGAGGGGFILFYCPLDKQRELNTFMKVQGFPRLDFEIDHEGSTILGNFLKK